MLSRQNAIPKTKKKAEMMSMMKRRVGLTPDQVFNVRAQSHVKKKQEELPAVRKCPVTEVVNPQLEATQVQEQQVLLTEWPHDLEPIDNLSTEGGPLFDEETQILDIHRFVLLVLSDKSPQPKLEYLPAIASCARSEDVKLQLYATTQIQVLLSREKNPPIEEVVQEGVVSLLVRFLKKNDKHELQLKAAHALTNILSGTSEHTKVVIGFGAVPIFVELLHSQSEDLREQAVLALGNIAADSPAYRDLILTFGALAPLLDQLNPNARPSILRNATWALSNFCSGYPQPAFDQTKSALPALQELIHLSDDEEVLTGACWTLSYLSDGTNDKIQAVIDSGVCQRLVDLLLHPSPSVLIPALRTVGNIVTGDDMQTQCIIEHQALPRLLNLLNDNPKKSIKKEICWILSNVTAGNMEQMQSVLEAGIISPLVNLLQNAGLDITEEVARAISNATFSGSHEHIKYLVSQGCIKPLCDLLNQRSPRILTLCLEGLENILKAGEAEITLGKTRGGELTYKNHYAQLTDAAGGLYAIERLQRECSTEIYKKAGKILEYFIISQDTSISCL